MLNQRQRDMSSSLFWLVIGLLFCLGSIKYGDIRAGFPSAGFFPFMGGAILMLLSGIQLLGAVFAPRAEDEKAEAFFPQQDTVRRLSISLIILFLYPISLDVLGFLITTFLFMVLILRCLEPQGWKTVLVTASLTSIVAYVLFEVLLKVQLPRGIWG